MKISGTEPQLHESQICSSHIFLGFVENYHVPNLLTAGKYHTCHKPLLTFYALILITFPFRNNLTSFQMHKIWYNFQLEVFHIFFGGLCQIETDREHHKGSKGK
jgi:hypothetical protein